MGVILRTDRLELRTWSAADLPIARAIWGDPAVMNYIDARGGLDGGQLAARLQLEIDCLSEHGTQYWPMFDRATGELAGCCGLKPWAHSDRPGPEMGFYLARAAWGKGLAEEAARGVIGHAFGTLGLSSLTAGHHPGNQAARKILARLGFRYIEDVLFKPTGRMHPSYELMAGAGPDPVR